MHPCDPGSVSPFSCQSEASELLHMKHVCPSADFLDAKNVMANCADLQTLYFQWGDKPLTSRLVALAVSCFHSGLDTLCP